MTTWLHIFGLLILASTSRSRDLRGLDDATTEASTEDYKDDRGPDLAELLEQDAGELVLEMLAGEELGDVRPGNKKFGFLANLNPGQLFEPINQKISEISEVLTHPNGFSFPRPVDLWKKLQQSGSQFFNGANSAIFGLGQIGGHDYPFPYRGANGKSLDEKRNRLKEDLDGYMETYKKPGSNSSAKNEVNAYFFPFLLGADRVASFAKNNTI